MLRHYTPEAFFDLWFWVSDFQLWYGHHYTLHDLIKAHYGQHRIVTTRVLLLLDSILFGMNGFSVVLINLGLLMGAALLLWRLARADGVALTGWTLPPLFWIALMVSVGQVENLIFPFQVQFAIMCLAACGAAVLLTQACSLPGRRGLVRAAGAGLCSIVAIFSMAGGVLMVPGLLVLMALRFARPAIWLIYGPLATIGIVLFFHHYPAAEHPPLLDAGLVATRVHYVGNFLGSVLTGFPNFAAGAGLCGLALFLTVLVTSMKRLAFAGLPMASGDAALIALGVGVFLCGSAASFTSRVMMGAQAALVSRYATMSLLFVAVLLALYARWGARAVWPAWIREVALPLAAGAVLLVVNAPVYDAIAAGWHYVVLSDAQLLRNDVGIEGPAPVIFLGKVDDVRDQVRFLHERGINMFAPQESPPSGLMARLRRFEVSQMPACRGYVDAAFPIDDSAFLLQGWLTGPAAKHSLRWVAAFDEHGTLLGTSRQLTPRPDVDAVRNLQQAALGFDAGFRLAPPTRFAAAPVPIRVAGLDPGADQPFCVLPQTAMVGPVQITPLEALGSTSARDDEPPVSDGFSAWTGKNVPFRGPVWSAKASNRPDATLRFSLRQPSASDRALIVPFLVPSGTAAGRISFRFADNTVLATPIRWLWDRPAWRAAVLPSGVMHGHGGVREVDVTAAAGTFLVTGAPEDAVLRPAWSRLF